MDVDHEKRGWRVICTENCEPTLEVAGAPIVNVEANFLIPADQQGVDGGSWRLDQILAGSTAARAICPTPKRPRSHSKISSVPGCLKISLSGNHKLPGYGVLSRMTLRFGLNIEAHAEKVDVVLIRVEHFASRSTLTKASSPFSYPPPFSLL